MGYNVQVDAMKKFFDQTLGLDRSAIIRGLLLAFSAWLAFAIASAWHMTNAYWAAMAVWVVVQPLRGMLFERAVMRVVGTAIGALVGFLILWFIPDSFLQIVVMTLWMSVCAAAMHIFKGIYPYAILLSGYTVPAVVLPSALTETYQPELGWARVVCTLIGVVVVTVVMSVYTPKASRKEYYGKARKLVADAVDFSIFLFKGATVEEALNREQEVLFRISQLESSARTIAAGSVRGLKQLRYVEALIASALEIMAAAVAIYRQHRHDEGRTVPDEEVRALSEYMERVAIYLREDDDTFKLLLAEPKKFLTHAPIHSDIGQRLCVAFEQLVVACSVLYRKSENLEPEQRVFMRPPRLASSREIEWAWQSALVTGSSALLISLLAWMSGSHAADIMTLSVCMFSMILASVPYPRIVMKKMFTGACIGALAALGYRLLFQPYIGTLSQLLIFLVPVMVICGLARISKRTAEPALDANTNFLLMGQVMFPFSAATPTLVIVETAAVVLGISGACLIALLLLPRRTDDQAYMAVGKLTRDLQRMLELSADYFKDGETEKDWTSHSEREVLRMMLHLSSAKALRAKAPRGVLGVLNFGSAIVRLQRLGNPVARQGLLALTYFAEDFDTTFKAVWNLARTNEDDPAGNILYEAADALVACEQLLTFARKPVKENSI